MKILAFVDSHALKRAMYDIKEKVIKEKPDLLVCGGDLSDFGKGLDIAAKFVNNLNITTLIIPGNHETPKDIENLCKKYKNFVNIHLKTYEIGNYIFFGYGTGGFSYREEKFERASKQFLKTLDKNKKLILVAHAPVYNTTLDDLDGTHAGCLSFRKFIEEAEPVLALCGHFHENEKKKDKIKNCLIVNPGKNGTIIKI